MTRGTPRVVSFNPTARIAAMALIATPLLISVDIVSAGVALVCELLVAPFLGMGWGRIIRRGWSVFMLAPLTGVSMLLYGRPEGKEYVSYAFAHITDNSVSLALAIMVRVLAIALPAVILSADTDPTDLGDGLAQIWHLPERFVIGSVAGVRLVSLFQRDYSAMHRARRARGLADSSRIRRTLTIFFALLVLALRRGGKLATAMEARGFGSDRPRTWARESRLRWPDWVLMVGALLGARMALVTAWMTGYLRFLGA